MYFVKFSSDKLFIICAFIFIVTLKVCIVEVESFVNNENFNSQLIIETKWGLIQGISEKVGKFKVRSFKGIPYAQPPIGILRFDKSYKLWRKHRGIFKAKNFGPACMQKPNNQTPILSEDCLQMNIWTPFISNKTDLLPVILFIHGSAFTHGSSIKSKYNAAYPSGEGNLVIVTINFRVGLFGYMYGGNRHSPGNQAHYDIIIAMQWIQDNIKSFGGDPNRVTLFGCSSGSITVALFMLERKMNLYNKNERKRYFHRAIMSSGFSMKILDSARESLRKAQIIAFFAGCYPKNRYKNYLLLMNNKTKSIPNLTSSQLKCLRKIAAADLIKYEYKKEINNKDPEDVVPFPPVYGDKWLPKSFKYYMENNAIISDTPILMGTLTYDSTSKSLSEVIKHSKSKEEIISVIEKFVDSFTPNIPENFDEIKNIYFGKIEDSDIIGAINATYYFLTDIYTHCPALAVAEKFSQNNRVYFYYLTYGLNNETWRPEHGEEVEFFFGKPHREPENYTDTDRKISQHVVKIWSNFAYGKKLWKPIEKINNETIFNEYEINPYIIENNHVDKRVDICKLWSEIGYTYW